MVSMLYSNLYVSEKEDLQKIPGKKISLLEPQTKDHTTHSRLEFLDLELSDIKLSLLQLHDKVCIVTFMLDSFMKGLVVEEVEVEGEEEEKGEEVEEEAAVEKEGEEEKEEKKEEKKEEQKVVTPIVQMSELVEVTPQPLDATSPSPTKAKPSKKRKTSSKK